MKITSVVLYRRPIVVLYRRPIVVLYRRPIVNRAVILTRLASSPVPPVVLMANK